MHDSYVMHGTTQAQFTYIEREQQAANMHAHSQPLLQVWMLLLLLLLLRNNPSLLRLPC
jgi:hypothetical protein